MTELIECAAYALKSLAAMRLLDGDGYDVTPTGYRGIQHTLGNWTKDSCHGGRDNGSGSAPSRFPFKSIKMLLKGSWTLDQAVFLTEEKDRWVKPNDEHTHTHTR